MSRHEVNGRRIAACVAACAGIPTEALEGLAGGTLSGTILDPEAARRLVACSRACEGVPTEALEGVAVAGLVAALLEDYEASFDELTDGQYGSPNTRAYVRAKGFVAACNLKGAPR